MPSFTDRTSDTAEDQITTIVQNTHPFTMGSVINRQASLHPDGTICKSVRIGQSNLDAEKSNLALVAAKTAVPVPGVRRYYVLTEIERLVIDKNARSDTGKKSGQAHLNLNASLLPIKWCR